MKKNTLHILVTGSKGQLGCELAGLAVAYPAFSFVFVDVDELDITDRDAVEVFLTSQSFDFCINCAAYTAVDKAETEQETAQRVNVLGAANLIAVCRQNDIRLIHYSTDYVYHNSQNIPFRENDETTPQGVYAQTKLEGDEAVLKGGGVVIRTSWVYSSYGHNFVKTMLRLGRERDALGVVFDQIGTPTYARDLAAATLEIIRKVHDGEVGSDTLSGVFHYSNEGVTSWYDFAKAIFEIENISVKVNPILTADYPLPAPRPPFSVLNKNKFKTTFGMEIPHWRESLKDCLTKL